MDLEFAIEADDADESFPLPMTDAAALAANNGGFVATSAQHGNCTAYLATPPWFMADWGPMIERIVAAVRVSVPAWQVAAMFHNSLAEGVVAAARRVGQRRVVLSGGCFQNRYLLERTVQRLHSEGFSVYWHQRVPPNDGGVALGQIMAAARRQKGT
jgi:hydrogenase maturation protein HypF